MTALTSADDATFSAIVVSSNSPVLVDFHAAWCGPCKAMAPALVAFATAHPGIRVVKVDIDSAPLVSAREGIRAVPTLKLYQDGVAVRSKAGAMTASQLADFVA